MAKQVKFSAERLASELVRTGNATASKADFMLARIATLAANHHQPSDKARPFLLAEVGEMLKRNNFLRGRMVHVNKAPDQVERLGIRFNGMTIRLSLRTTTSGNSISCSLLAGSINLPQLTSAIVTTEFILELDKIMPKWAAEWEQILFNAWQSAKNIETASAGIEKYADQKVKEAGLKHTISVQSNYAEIRISVARGIKLTAKVPHAKYETPIDNLISEASKLNKALTSLSDDINISI